MERFLRPTSPKFLAKLDTIKTLMDGEDFLVAREANIMYKTKSSGTQLPEFRSYPYHKLSV